MKKHPLILAGLMILAGIAGISRADTIVSVTETHYDTYLRPDCVAVRMNTATFADAASNACALKSAGTQGADRITKTVYDAAGQVTQVIQAYGTANQRAYSTFSYSGNGKVIDTIDANGNRSHNVYDSFDRLITFYYPSTTRPTAFNASTQATALSTAGAYADATHGSDYEAFTYDNNGNRLTTRRRDGQILTDCYDALNRQIVHYVHSQSGCTATGGAKDVYTTYDLQGHILTKRFASTSGSGVSYAYDGRGRIASSTDMFNRTVSYQYNKADARTRLTDNEGYYVAYALDTLNRPTQATLNGTTNVLYGQTFNSLGQRTLLSRGASSAGGSTTYAYDNLSRLQGIAIDTAGTSYDVTWGKVGAVGSVAYNPAGQITNWASSNTIFNYAEIAGSIDARTYDGLNRDAGVAALTGGYDARGNLTTDGTRTFTYDVENRLLTSTGGTNPLTLVYDPEGRLARVTSGSTTKDFLYDGVDLIAEYNSNDTVAARYIHGPGTDDPLVWLQGADDSDRRYYYTNYQGSLIGYTGPTGSFVTSSLTKYGAYGEPRNSNNVESWPASRFGYTGQVVLADAKLYYYKARVYDPVFGRFLQTDPVGSKDDLDLYAYTAGDPINRSDPSGTQEEGRRDSPLEEAIDDIREIAKLGNEVRNEIFERDPYVNASAETVRNVGAETAQIQCSTSPRLAAAQAAARTGGASTQSQTFYRGDTSGRTEFQSYARQTGGQANSESTLQAKGFDRAASDHTGSSALPPSPLISVTIDINEARTFAGSTGSVYQLAIPSGVAVPNPAPIEPGEHFVPHYIPPSWIVGTVK